VPIAEHVIHRVLVLTSFACCALVTLSFTMFARDQLAGASEHQQQEIVAGSPPAPRAVPVHTAHGQPRRFIDAAAHALTSPFDSVVLSNSAWVSRGVPALLALVVYGLGLGYLARYSAGMR
jgi:hypothetical protein